MGNMGTGQNLTVAIIGGGIGGLAFAVALGKTGANIDIDIYEGAKDLHQIGAGIGFWPRAWEVMRSLGLEKDLSAADTTPQQDVKITYYRGDEEGLLFCGQAQGAARLYHRCQFLRILQAHLSFRTCIHLNKRLITYKDSPPKQVALFFEDGTTAQCDILVGADGVRSTVRAALFEDLAEAAQEDAIVEKYRSYVDAKWAGLVGYRALVPTDALKAEYPDHIALDKPVFFVGKQRCLICYPVSQGTMINVVAYVIHPNCRGSTYDGELFSQSSPTEEEELLSKFSQWDGQVYSIIKRMRGVTKWVVSEVKGLPSFASGRVALLGDAAHAMVSCIGAGATQAVEDGVLLAALIAQPETQKHTINHALQVYDEIRRPFTQHVQDLSFKAGEIIWLDSPQVQSCLAGAAEDVSARELEEQISTGMTNLLQWQWSTSLKPDIELAVQRLKSNVARY